MAQYSAESVRTGVARVDALPSIPLLRNILKAYAGPADPFDLDQLIATIQLEPSFTAKVLALANSAYYAPARPIDTVRAAAATIGSRRLREAVLNLAISSALRTLRCPAFNTQRFWYDAMMLAHACNALGRAATREELPAANALYCMGLLNNLGVLVFAHLFPEGFAAAVLAPEGGSLAARERVVFGGLDHRAVGATLLARWGLPEAFHLSAAYCDQAQYRGSHWPAVSAIHLSKELLSTGFETPAAETLDILGVNPDDIAAVRAHCKEEEAFVLTFMVYL